MCPSYIKGVLEWQKPPSLLLHTKSCALFYGTVSHKNERGLFPAAAAKLWINRPKRSLIRLFTKQEKDLPFKVWL